MSEDTQNIETSPGAEKLADNRGVTIEEVYGAGYYRSNDGKVLKKHVQDFLDGAEQDDGDTYDILNRHGQYVRTFEPNRHEDPKEKAEMFKKKHYPDGEIRTPSAVPEKNRK